MYKRYYFKVVFIFTVTLFTGSHISDFSFGSFQAPTVLSASYIKDKQTNIKPRMVKKTMNNIEHNINKEELFYLTTTFMEKLVQQIDDNYRVQHFNTKEQLLDDFEEIMLREIAELYVDFYYVEKDGELYIVPTETPPWFDEQKEYDMIKLANDQIKVVQENDSLLYGNYIIELELTYQDKWIITDVVVK